MIIYKITNLINKKIYIGKTINDKDDYYGSGILIKRSIRKYGLENFSKEIIDNAGSVDELNEKEKYWINKESATDLNIGYNISDGGDGGDMITNNPNKEHFIEYCKDRTGKKNGMFGKKHTSESIDKMSKNRKGKCKGLPTWNKGLTKDDYSDEYVNKLKDKKGSKNPNSKSFTIISPSKEEFLVIGSIDSFSKSNNFYPTTLRYFVDKGIIPETTRKSTQQRKNLVGWEIKRNE